MVIGAVAVLPCDLVVVSINMDLKNDKRIVLTLDAGGTNFVFSALQGGEEIVEPVTSPAFTEDLTKSLQAIINGFKQVRKRLSRTPNAISFAFPGPADYPAGIINNVGNLPAYSGGVALGPMLEDEFGLPVFINNDGDLFAYGEAMAGLLPEINGELSSRDIPKRYKNLLGVTIGTGFGGGIIVKNSLLRGDNSASGEIWVTRNFDYPRMIAEEGVSIRAVQRAYKEFDPNTTDLLSPKDIYDIAKGEKQGNTKAAINAFEKMGKVLAESIANAITLIDGAIVIGGGISAASDLFLPVVIKHLNGKIIGDDGKKYQRLVSTVYSLENTESANDFYSFTKEELTVPFSERCISYASEKRIPIGITRLGTSKAIALGAYFFALENIQAS
mgnify:CR=1 FL=1